MPSIPYLHMKKIRRKEFQATYGLNSSDAERKVEVATTLLQKIAASYHSGKPAMHAVLSVIRRSDLWDMNILIESQGHLAVGGTMDMPDYLWFIGYAQVVLDYTYRMFPDLDRVDFVASRNGKVTLHCNAYLAGIKKRLLRPAIVGDLIPGDPIKRNPLQMADVLWASQTTIRERNRR